MPNEQVWFMAGNATTTTTFYKTNDHPSKFKEGDFVEVVVPQPYLDDYNCSSGIYEGGQYQIVKRKWTDTKEWIYALGGAHMGPWVRESFIELVEELKPHDPLDDDIYI